MPDLDLDSLKRSIDLTQYARSKGYQEKPRDAVPGITVLEHERLGDRIAVARLASGGIYARIPDYAPRGPDEPDELARRRLRDSITRAGDTGSIVEFVRSNERRAGRPEPDPKRVRDHLMAWWQASRELPRGPEPHPDPNVLNRRMGDWGPSPPPPGRPDPSEVQAGPQGRREAIDAPLAQVEERLRRWQEAQSVLDLKLWREAQSALDRKLARGAELAESPADTALSRAPSREKKSELGLRRYDWSPPPPSRPAIPLGRGARGRGEPERDR